MTAPATLDSTPETLAADGGRGSARRFGLVAVAVAVVVGLLLGYAGGLLTPRLTRPGDASVEAGFARDMTAHHAQAVEMGLMAFQRATDPEVRGMGGDIATGQQGEIGTMQTWLRSWGLDPTGSQPRMAWMPDGTATVKDGLMPGMATPAEMEKLRAAQGREFDLLFLNMMIKHHLGGIHMIDGVLDASDEPDVVRSAQTMKNTQQTDLTNMRNALKRLGG
ncbi:DUF305 domain-containing protein [Micromonospora sp. WMMD812]|uniref:DUF305 domain-containing protein n=1 Tax=Micromonospora sp. WMMD812 TaxID=3015152 RepID=UPI00248D07E9|nr:DUF305 domain-containing protein [Micromonospora sp. WMMD812]WBB66693.1 DUF305 domain-containing protein [Micromonospora sp. WMMD812]